MNSGIPQGYPREHGRSQSVQHRHHLLRPPAAADLPTRDQPPLTTTYSSVSASSIRRPNPVAANPFEPAEPAEPDSAEPNPPRTTTPSSAPDASAPEPSSSPDSPGSP